MTKVEECTRADTGVGAAIAAGNHLENGICALLVQPATIIISAWKPKVGVGHIFVIVQ